MLNVWRKICVKPSSCICVVLDSKVVGNFIQREKRKKRKSGTFNSVFDGSKSPVTSFLPLLFITGLIQCIAYQCKAGVTTLTLKEVLY